MAKKSSKSDRQAVIDEIRKKQKGAEKRRGYAIVGVCSLVALLIVGAAAYRPVKNWWDLRQVQGHRPGLDRRPGVGVREGDHQAGRRQQQHVPTGAAGHLRRPPRRRSARTGTSRASPPRRSTGSSTPRSDRPELESLVHNLEHGYTILWYDETIADDGDELNVIDGIADKFRSDSDNLRLKFIAAPWTAEDEKESGKFPEGMHVAFSHWSAGGSGETDTSKQVGAFQYCSRAERRGAEGLHAGVPLHRLARAGRAVMGAPERIAIVSGYFNPIHIGHLRMIKAARELAPHLVVIVNNDRQQLLKKGRDPHDRGGPARDRRRAALRRRGLRRRRRRLDRGGVAAAGARALPRRRAALLQRRRPLATPATRSRARRPT